VTREALCLLLPVDPAGDFGGGYRVGIVSLHCSAPCYHVIVPTQLLTSEERHYVASERCNETLKRHILGGVTDL
jgi:hypothetical protein